MNEVTRAQFRLGIRECGLVFTVVVLQKCYRRLQHCRLVHLPIRRGDECTQVVHQRVELIPSLLLAEVAGFPANKTASYTKMNNLVKNRKEFNCMGKINISQVLSFKCG